MLDCGGKWDEFHTRFPAIPDGRKAGHRRRHHRAPFVFFYGVGDDLTTAAAAAAAAAATDPLDVASHWSASRTARRSFQSGRTFIFSS